MGDALEVYYEPESTGGYGGVARLRQVADAGKSETDEFLKRKRTYTLHKPARLRFSTRPYKVAGIDQQWQADLVEMIPYERVNDGYRYLLTVIDLFSRFAWAKPIKTRLVKKSRGPFKKYLTQAVNVSVYRLMMDLSLPIGTCSTYSMSKILDFLR